MRVVHQVHLEPLDRDFFRAMLEHGLPSAGAAQTVLADPARELLFRASRGVPRVASNPSCATPCARPTSAIKPS